MSADEDRREKMGHLLRKLQRVRKEKLAAAYEEAARDPVFMQDMHDVDTDWDVTSSDGLDAAD